MNRFKWLLRREFWEHKGGFFWAPIIAGGLFVLINIMVLAVGVAAAGRAHVQIGLLKLDQVMANMSPEVLQATVAGVDVTVMMISSMVALVSAVVVFFYCLGSLYDDRRDRSVLFWKSLPVSDVSTVLSKAFSALFLAPGIGLLAGVATAVAILIVVSVFFAFHGQNFFGIVFLDAHPFRVALLALASLPLAALWALPTVGWLMLCSAWARSKPFLWAVGVPIGAGIIVSWFDLMQSIGTPDSWFWKNVVARLLLSVAPGGWMFDSPWEQFEGINSPLELTELISFSGIYSSLASVNLWIGALAGAAMIYASTHLRRRRDEA
jgi:ABC-2 type transport system permease protein